MPPVRLTHSPRVISNKTLNEWMTTYEIFIPSTLIPLYWSSLKGWRFNRIVSFDSIEGQNLPLRSIFSFPKALRGIYSLVPIPSLPAVGQALRVHSHQRGWTGSGLAFHLPDKPGGSEARALRKCPGESLLLLYHFYAVFQYLYNKRIYPKTLKTSNPERFLLVAKMYCPNVLCRIIT